jgi:hypothetical protein
MTLTLKKDVLSELSPADLTQVVGGSHHCMTIPFNLCLSYQECEASHEAACQVPTYRHSCAC